MTKKKESYLDDEEEGNVLKPTNDLYVKETIANLIKILESRSDTINYIFPIAKLRGCIEKMPKDKKEN